MKICKKLDDYILERTSKILEFHKNINNTMSNLDKRKIMPVIQSLETLEKEYKRMSRKAIIIVDELNEIEKLLDEVRYE